MLITIAFLLAYSSIQPVVGKEFVGQSHMSSVFENINKTKKGWWERFNLDQKMNESELEQKWYNWTTKWKEKYNKTTGKFKEKWRNVNHEFKNLTKNHTLVGKGFLYENDYGVGNFVKFMFNDTDIIDYTAVRYEDVTVFDFIHINGFHPTSDPETHGAVWRVSGENASVEIHDNPTIMLKIKTLNQSCVVTFYPNSEVILNQENNRTINVKGEIDGKIILAAEGSIKVTNLSVTVTVENRGGCILFMAEPNVNNSVCIRSQWRYEDKIAKHIAKGKVFARVIVDNNGFDDMVFVNGTVDCLTFKNRIKVKLNGSEKSGKTVIIDVSNKVLNVSNLNRLKVILDGKEMVLENYSSVLNETGVVPMYAVINGSNGLTILVYLPHFSTHTIEIYSEGFENNSSTPGFEILFAVFSILVVVIVTERKH